MSGKDLQHDLFDSDKEEIDRKRKKVLPFDSRANYDIERNHYQGGNNNNNNNNGGGMSNNNGMHNGSKLILVLLFLVQQGQD